ncbi:restriction endonuclease [uncultured Pseudomonas sp.]|uniref:restriction endonuclease n=1 Tax=uncultured Pseudomonas sp. TaxID=114707 RepID=UPI002586A394|nr:restriction endonuclease [uncultured Pseudomonas sp.]
MPNGKDYEHFVKTLQQALLYSELIGSSKNIEIESNKKITDSNGIEREFDLYWEYELAGVTYKTVIECKDYASRVTIEKIDALIGKIRDIPDLKPVFATKTGYQSGAETKARANKIDLLIVREQSAKDWQDKDGQPYVREINIRSIINMPAKITEFNPLLDGKWLKENTDLDPKSVTLATGLNTEIFIEDLERGESYSLYELAQRLPNIAGKQYGKLKHSESFGDAYLLNNGTRLKLVSYKVNYINFEPTEETWTIDLSKELIGVIEYLHKGTKTAVFSDKIITNWK